MKISGKEIIHTSSSFSCPRQCASCMAPSTTEVTAKKRKSVYGGSETLTMDIPYCSECASRARMAQWREWGVTAAVALPVVLFAALSYVLPNIPLAAVIAMVTVPSLIVAGVAMTVLAPKMPPAPATHPGEAVKITSFKLHEKSTLFCSNPQWADLFMQANPGTATGSPKEKNHIFALGALPIALLGGPLAAFGAFYATHPTVHVDNPSADALVIFSDGKHVADVGPNSSTSFTVGHGKHTFGYAKGGASAPTATVETAVEVNDAHLYNPGKSGCYWLDASSYGTATVKGMQQGPQSLQEFYKWDKVDTWWGTNPTSIDPGKGNSGGTRVAVQRDAVCMNLAAKGCGVDARDKLMMCQKAAYQARNKATFDACEKDAATSCHAGGGAKPTAAAPPPPAHKK